MEIPALLLPPSLAIHPDFAPLVAQLRQAWRGATESMAPIAKASGDIAAWGKTHPEIKDTPVADLVEFASEMAAVVTAWAMQTEKHATELGLTEGSN